MSELGGFTFLVAAGSFLAGFLGALTGLGGGVVIVPMLTLLFGVDLRFAVGASLVAVIGTSSGAAAAYVREGFSNIRIGMLLEIATTLGALGGAFLHAWLPSSLVAVLFGLVLLHSAFLSLRPERPAVAGEAADPLAARLRLDGSYPGVDGTRHYHVRRVPQGFALMSVAGVLSGVLGIGSGALKVLAMDRIMGVPFKVSTTTSNFMIGVTAAASAGIYLGRGDILPELAMPVILGVLGGALLGTRVLARVRARWLRLVFGVVITGLAIEMLVQGLRGRI